MRTTRERIHVRAKSVTDEPFGRAGVNRRANHRRQICAVLGGAERRELFREIYFFVTGLQKSPPVGAQLP